MFLLSLCQNLIRWERCEDFIPAVWDAVQKEGILCWPAEHRRRDCVCLICTLSKVEGSCEHARRIYPTVILQVPAGFSYYCVLGCFWSQLSHDREVLPCRIAHHLADSWTAPQGFCFCTTKAATWQISLLLPWWLCSSSISALCKAGCGTWVSFFSPETYSLTGRECK